MSEPKRLRRSGAAALASFGALLALPTLCGTAHADELSDIFVALGAAVANAQTEITDAPATLSATDAAILSGQSQALDAQAEFLNQLQTLQESYTAASPTDLANLDILLFAPVNDVDGLVGQFLNAAETASPLVQFVTGLELANADFSLLGTDLNVLVGSVAAEYLSNADLSTLLP